MMQQKNRKIKRHKRPIGRNLFLIAAGIFMYLAVLAPAIKQFLSNAGPFPEEPGFGPITINPADQAALPEELKHLLELNPEAADFVKSYPDRDAYRVCAIDLTQDFVSGQVPLLMQWDKRWGYNDYGDSSIGLAGCGPVCLEMAYLYFTEDTDFTPRDMAEYAYQNGYCTLEGTSWSLWTEGTGPLGLSGSELPLDEGRMCQALDEGKLIVCSMRPGDFTTTGHFILIRGYDENGFFVNDPNRRSNSEKQWDYATLQYQIRNLWELAPLEY